DRAMLMCQTPKFWDAFCTAVERPDLKADQRFIDIPTRRQNIEALTEALDVVMQTKTTDEWLVLLGGQVPFAPVRGLKEALDNPYVAEVGMRDVVDHPERPEGLHLLACPIKIDGRRASGVRAPLMGEHNAELLDEGAA
ncbi:CoA transferase, partial [Brevundimonas naejangsanensis]